MPMPTWHTSRFKSNYDLRMKNEMLVLVHVVFLYQARMVGGEEGLGRVPDDGTQALEKKGNVFVKGQMFTSSASNAEP